MSSATPHRIDPPSTEVPRPIGQNLVESESRKRVAIANAAVELATTQNLRSNPAEPLGRPMKTEPPALAAGPEATVDQPTRPEASAYGSQENAVSSAQPMGGIPIQDEWLRLHATDLIDRLRAWASDLDAREAQLNSRTSIQEHRERRFRLRQQDLATELAEQQRSIERLRHEIEAQARRLAFQNDPG